MSDGDHDAFAASYDAVLERLAHDFDPRVETELMISGPHVHPAMGNQ